MLKIGQIYKAQEDTKAIKVREGAKVTHLTTESIGYVVIPLSRKLVSYAAPYFLSIKEFKQKYPVLHQPQREPPAA